jgi:divalent metal cation (Fe/Co/Zn/Cd) transporter
LIARMGGGLALQSAQHLMDQACRDEEARIKAVFLQHKAQFIEFHDVKTRRNGNQIFSELHLSVDSALTVKAAHDLTDHLEGDVKREVPNITLTIHIEPQEP